MSLKVVDLLIKGYERVVHATNEVTKLNCIAVSERFVMLLHSKHFSVKETS